MVTVIDAEHF